jgi:hypothetical protein
MISRRFKFTALKLHQKKLLYNTNSQQNFQKFKSLNENTFQKVNHPVEYYPTLEKKNKSPNELLNMAYPYFPTNETLTSNSDNKTAEIIARSPYLNRGNYFNLFYIRKIGQRRTKNCCGIFKELLNLVRCEIACV